MEELVKKTYNPNDYERASLEDYGYKEHKGLKITWKVISIILLCFSIFMLYFAVIIIAIQSFNSSDSTTEFASTDNFLITSNNFALY